MLILLVGVTNMEKGMGSMEENNIRPMKVGSYQDLLLVIDMKVERMEISDVTTWYMESIGTNEKTGDIFFISMKMDRGTNAWV